MSKFSEYNFKDQKALIRVDFNVPLNEKCEITDDNRIRAAIPTIKKVLADGGSVILMSHLGRPKGGPEDKYSLKHLIKRLADLLRDNKTVSSSQLAVDQQPSASSQWPPGFDKVSSI